MSDDEEFMKFEVTDYDLENEFGSRRRHRLSKQQQIYGIWADKEDSDDDEKGGKTWLGKKKKDYTAPLSFVAGGVQVAGKRVDQKNEEGKEEAENESDVAEVSSDSSNEDDSRPVGNFKKQGKVYKKMTEIHGVEELAGLRKYPSRLRETLLAQKGVGNWEKHTKGIGAKLLLQMGYQPGKGLGKDLQGIQAPIEAQLRKGRGAIGAYGPEKKAKEADILLPPTEQTDSGKPKVQRASHWKKQVASGEQSRIRYVYKSIDDVLEENKRFGSKRREVSDLSRVKVIDMTGPEQRILSGYHAIAGVQKPIEEWEIRREKKYTNFSLPELQHNLDLLVDLTEQAIIENDQKLKQDEDRIAVIKNQMKSTEQVLQQDKVMIDNLTKVLEMTQTAMTKHKENTLTLEEASEMFIKIREEYCNEFVVYEIPYVAGEVIKPLINKLLEEWKPLEDPLKPIPLFTHWKSVLMSPSDQNVAASAYHKLLHDTWFPCIQAAINLWPSRDWAPMVELVASWAPLISNWLLDLVLQDLILNKIQQEVNDWNPLTDCVPIHSWIYPWMNFLGKHFEMNVYPTIRQKLSAALVGWHPSDCSARLMLQPWMNVFDPGEMELFLANNILPKLQVTLQEFIINPQQQQLDNWNWVMEWCEMIPPPMMAMMLDKHFFRKWNKVLTMWLTMNPDYEQVSRWYSGWKALIPERILAQPVIKDHLRVALDTMSRSVGGPSWATAEEQEAKQRAENLAEAIRTASKIPEGFKDLVQKRCEERGILWMPIPHRTIEAKQVFRCGRLQVYIDRSVLFVSQEGGSFVPMSLNELLSNAH